MFLSLAGTDPEVATIFSRMDDDDKEKFINCSICVLW